MKSSKVLYRVIIVATTLVLSVVDAAQTQKNLILKNDSGQKAEIYWLDGQGEMVLQTPSMENGQTLSLNSYVNHTFLVRELPDESGSCNPGTPIAQPSLAPCKTAFITVNEHDDQVIHILEDMEVEVKDSHSKAREITNSITNICQTKVKQQIRVHDDPIDAIDKFITCTSPLATRQFEEYNKKIKKEASLRTQLATQWEDYTCADQSLSTTTPKSLHNWNYQGEDHTVGVLLDRDEAKIHYIKNFISSEECAAIESAASSNLHEATVADGAGGSQLISSRKALQAGVRVPWGKEADGDSIAVLARRLYTYVNEATGYGIEEAGQEDIMSIQYVGRGVDDPEPDRYMPHCDGQCDGLQFQQAGRVATMVMYCESPDRGGATNFRNVGIHILPEVGTAAFFSYLGSDGTTDNKLTEHSCCPVLEGSKKIAVQWLRLGVDEENPWNSFNTLNVKIGSEEL